MPLFICSECGCVDNTAMGNYWMDVYGDNRPPLCTECDPRIKKWHGRFPKLKYVPGREVLNPPKES